MTDKVNALTNILLTGEAQTEMAQAQAQAATVAEMASWPCDGPEDETTLALFLGNIQDRLRTLEKARKAVADPLTQAKRALDGLFSAVAAPYEAAKDAIKAKLELAENGRLAALRLAQAAALANPSPAALVAVAASSQPSAGSFRMVWEWDLVDISAVPPDFLALNRPALVAYVERFKSSDTIEGVPGITFRRVAKAVAR